MLTLLRDLHKPSLPTTLPEGVFQHFRRVIKQALRVFQAHAFRPPPRLVAQLDFPGTPNTNVLLGITLRVCPHVNERLNFVGDITEC